MGEIQSSDATPSTSSSSGGDAPNPASENNPSMEGGNDTKSLTSNPDSQNANDNPILDTVEELVTDAMNIVTDLVASVADALGLIPDIETGNIPKGIQDGKQVIQDVEKDAEDIEKIIKKLKEVEEVAKQEVNSSVFKDLMKDAGEFISDVKESINNVENEFKNKNFGDIPETFFEGVKKSEEDIQKSFNGVKEVIADCGEKLKEQKSHDAPKLPEAQSTNTTDLTPKIPDSVKNAAVGLLDNAQHATTETAKGASQAIGEMGKSIGSLLGK